MQAVRIHWFKEGMGLLCVCTQLSTMIPGLCQVSILQALSCAPACPVPAAKVGTGVPGAEREQWRPDLPVH